MDMTTLELKAAFFHVIDDHRWLAASGCAWNLVGANVTDEPSDYKAVRAGKENGVAHAPRPD